MQYHTNINLSTSMLHVAGFFVVLMPSFGNNETERGILNTDDYRHENERCSTTLFIIDLVLYVTVSCNQGEVYCFYLLLHISSSSGSLCTLHRGILS
jgi:hypothetical protein